MSAASDRRTWCRRAGASAAAWLLAGCAGLGLREPVQVNVVGIEPLAGEGMEMRMAVKLRVQNPNDAALEFDGVSLSLDLRGSAFATGVSPQRGSIPRFGEAVVTVPVSISALAAARQVIGLATRDRSRVDYALRGRLSGPGFGGMRFESKGEIEMPKGWATD
ncbi:MAG TPA: LEA type 2 family protein [Albitalea sp.]|nr:LEA type 2 family protein [Albitalea sp.]